HQLDAFVDHVVQIFRHARHLAGGALDRDHGHFFGALAQRLAGAVDGGVAAADHCHARAEPDLRRAHADIAQERQAVEDARLVFSFGAYAVRLRETDCQHAGIVILLQIAPADILADLGIRLDRDAELLEPLDFAIEHRLRQDPVGNAAAIEPARLWRLLENGDGVAEPRQLIRGAVARRSGSDDRNLFPIRGAGLDHIARQRLTE